VHGAGSPKQGRPGGRPLSAGGRYSKNLPDRLAERYEQSRNDTELLAMREDISLIDARISDILKRVDTGEAGAVWKKARDVYDELVDALAKKDAVLASAKTKTLGDVIKRGQSDYAAWNEIVSLVDQRRKLIEAEQKRLVAANYILKVEEATLLMSALAAAVKKYVPDSNVLFQINQEFIRLSERVGKQDSLSGIES